MPRPRKGGTLERTGAICLLVALVSSNAWKRGVGIGRGIPVSARWVGGALARGSAAGDYVREQLLCLCGLQPGKARFMAALW